MSKPTANSIRHALAVLLVMLLPATLHAASKNVVVRYLQHAELQAETKEQEAEIARALKDMLDKPVADLKAARYADYQGKPGAWTLPELLHHYYVPDSKMSLDDDAFYRDLSAREAREVVKKCMRQLEAEH